MKEKSFGTLTDFIINNSFYLFTWPLYFSSFRSDKLKDDDIKIIKSINESISKLNVKNNPFTKLESLYKLFETSPILREALLKNYVALPEKIAMTNTAKVNLIPTLVLCILN